MKNNGAGFSLIGLSMLMIVLGIGLSTTLMFLVPAMERTSREKSVAILKADRNALIGFASAKGRLPEAREYLSDSGATVVPSLVDGYHNRIHYIYDKGLSTPGSVCARSTANLSICPNATECPQSGAILNVAFALWSDGSNGMVNGGLAAPDKTEATRNIPHPRYLHGDNLDDLLEWVTLDELQQRVGCGVAIPDS
ncbi:MAG: hypothetical protein HQL94_01755 [Magnetococcales bacterium]|nr:hypothetical protein [Magnetococcales bacterium]MBF0438669.1 hypothetical protein [Magnetococcales bacterium]